MSRVIPSIRELQQLLQRRVPPADKANPDLGER